LREEIIVRGDYNAVSCDIWSCSHALLLSLQ